MRNRFTTRNQWFTETNETIRTSGLTLIISTIRFFKTYTAEFGFKQNRLKTTFRLSIGFTKLSSFYYYAFALFL
ncbi:MAG: hypothetical protein KBF75_07025 [Saprospiraceae bacterium]|nr:hypothetical protein [Saprospiraceae bacterium]MCA0332397.1 hypothetical protein [Bacteroidota bacterium]